MVAKKPTAEEMSSSRIRDGKPQVSPAGCFGIGFITSIVVSPVLWVFVDVVLTVVLVGDRHCMEGVRADCLDIELDLVCRSSRLFVGVLRADGLEFFLFGRRSS